MMSPVSTTYSTCIPYAKPQTDCIKMFSTLLQTDVQSLAMCTFTGATSPGSMGRGEGCNQGGGAVPATHIPREQVRGL